MAGPVSFRNTGQERQADGMVYQHRSTRHIQITFGGGGQNGQLSITVRDNGKGAGMVKCPYCGHITVEIESGDFDPPYTEEEVRILFGGEG